MKFGVLQFFSWPERRTPFEKIYERALDRIQTMEKKGYDAVWLTEHHFSTYSVCPAIHLMATHIAATTERIRIGTAVSLAAFYNPVRLAEEVAMLDIPAIFLQAVQGLEFGIVLTTSPTGVRVGGGN